MEPHALESEVGSSCYDSGFAEPHLDTGTGGWKKQNEAANPRLVGEKVRGHKELVGG